MYPYYGTLRRGQYHFYDISTGEKKEGITFNGKTSGDSNLSNITQNNLPAQLCQGHERQKLRCSHTLAEM